MISSFFAKLHGTFPNSFSTAGAASAHGCRIINWLINFEDSISKMLEYFRNIPKYFSLNPWQKANCSRIFLVLFWEFQHFEQ